jgi:hypothetical protein
MFVTFNQDGIFSMALSPKLVEGSHHDQERKSGIIRG